MDMQYKTEAEQDEKSLMEGENEDWVKREMDVKIGFWEIMNLHILIEKSMLSTKKKKMPQLIFRITKCVRSDCIVYMDVIERSFEWTITDLHFEGSSPLRLSSVIKIDECVILYQIQFFSLAF